MTDSPFESAQSTMDENDASNILQLPSIDHVMSDISNMVEASNVKSEAIADEDNEVKDNQDDIVDQPVSRHVKNPWSFSTLEDFLFYCCPECPHKCRSSISFTKHALKYHPKAIEKLGHHSYDFDQDDSSEENHSEEEADENPMLEDKIKLEVECDLETPDGDFIVPQYDDEDGDENEDYVPKRKSKRKRTIYRDPNSDFQCYHCGKIIQTLASIKEHITEVHKCPPRRFGEPRPFNCDQCGAAFEKEKTLLNHICTNLIPIDSKDGEPLTCTKCDQTFASKRNLATHMLGVHTEEKNFSCNQCDYKAKSQLLITKHIRRLHHRERTHQCDLCPKSFFEKWNLTDHIVAVHHKKKPYVCDKCGKSFSQKSGLSSHNTFQHPEPGKALPPKRKREWKTEPTPCERCGKILMSKYSLEKHILHTHENVRRFNCETCGKTFKSNSNLKEHISQVHLNQRPFNCTQCDFGSSHKSRLEIHVKTVHQEPQDFPCEYCPHVCHKKKELQSHIKAVHGKMKNHKCDLCDSAFYRRRDKDKHMVKAHNHIVDPKTALPEDGQTLLELQTVQTSVLQTQQP